jgi:hypothetical protein
MERMPWSEPDEQLYQALALEQRLSEENITEFAANPAQPLVPCNLSEIVLEKRQAGWFFLMPRARWLADPLNPYYLTLLILWIPSNILYLGFQVIRFMVTLRFTRTSLTADTLQFTARQVYFGSAGLPQDYTLPYREITSLGYYVDGLRIGHRGRTLFLASPAAPWLFIALTHLAHAGSVNPGISVPTGFIARCAAERTAIDTSKMRRNPPPSWSPEPTEFRLPVPWQRWIGYAVITLLVIAIFL